MNFVIKIREQFYFSYLGYQLSKALQEFYTHSRVLIDRICIALIALTISTVLFSCTSKNVSNKSIASIQLIDSLLNAAIENNEIPGAVAYINKGGKQVYHKAFGYSKLEPETPMQTDNIFRMASMTKGLTAVAVLQLNEHGLLFLDDELSKYIAEFKKPQLLVDVLPDSSFSSEPAASEITIRQLLTHTSGIGYGFQDDRYNALVLKNKVSEGFEDDDRTSIENTKLIAALPLLANPGQKYIYSLSYDVLGTLIEVITGMRYDQYITENILKPLEMNDSYFVVPIQEQPRLVNCYEPTNEGFKLTSYPDTAYPRLAHRQFFSGGADLCSTAEDYGKFIRMVKNYGELNGKRIIGKRYIEMMLMKQTNLDDGGYDQGFATWVTNEIGAAEGPMGLGSYGFGGFWDTYSWVDPKLGYSAVLLLQMYPCNEHKIHEKFQNIVYGVIEEL